MGSTAAYVGLRRRRTLLGLLTVGAALAVAAPLTTPATATAASAGHRPRVSVASHRQNIAPVPDFTAVCAAHRSSAHCTRLVLAAIRHARVVEHVKRPTMVLPRNYTRLSVPEQTFVITDLERVARGLRPFSGLVARLNRVSRVAARLHADPSLAAWTLGGMQVQAAGANWAGDFGPLASDYDWMYNDGYATGGVNIGCPSPDSPGCWGHRTNILGSYGGLPTLVSGAGTWTPKGASIATIYAAGRGKAPRFTYTWKRALAHGAGRRLSHG